MNGTHHPPTLAERLGFAVGVGLVFVATLGVYWHFWRPEAGFWLWGGGSFAVGAVIGSLTDAWRSPRR